MQPLHDASLHLAPSWESVEHALARASTPEAVHALLVHDLAEAAGAVAASVALLDTTGEWVEVVTSRGYEPDVIRQLSRFRVDADLPLADAIRTDRVLVVSSPVEIVRRYSGVRPAQVAKRRRSIACIPIRFGGQTVGAVGLSFEVALDAAG
ncbi:MAG: GAF domain-containing protein, partial [Actinomycetota bacterium]